MTTPVNMEKELKDWTFDDLCKWACWTIISGMTEGRSLRSSVYTVIEVATRWKPKDTK